MIENISKKVGQKFGGSKISRTFASQLRNKQTLNESKTGCSAVRLAHLLWEQGVPGSNPGTPTYKVQLLISWAFFSSRKMTMSVLLSVDPKVAI